MSTDSVSDNTPSLNAVCQAVSQEFYGLVTLNGPLLCLKNGSLRRTASPYEQVRYRRPVLLWKEDREQALGSILNDGS